MTSHEYAVKLKELAELLLSKPEFSTPYSERTAYTCLYYWSDKANFLEAVKALGSGKKEWGKTDLTYVPAYTNMLQIKVMRNAVCRLVREAEYDCEPLLSQAEEEQVGA